MTDNDPFLADLQAIADRAHADASGASAPPSRTWQRVLRQAEVTTQPERNPAMHTQSIQSHQPTWSAPTTTTPSGKSARTRISRFANLAATLAMVLALAAGGWLAAMQLNQPGPPEPRFAVIPATPEGVAQTCDVEPLTVDEVMEIVENPYSFLMDRAEDTSGADILRPASASDQVEASLVPDRYQYETADTMVPPNATFDDARETVDSFLTCLPSATYGQVWAMTDPVWVQQLILGRFPVYVTEDEVLKFVQGSINQPLSSVGDPLHAFYQSDQSFTINANPNRDDAHVALTASGSYSSIVAIGGQITGADGEVILATDSIGNSSILRATASPQRPVLVVGKSAISGEWYLLPWLGDKSITI